MCKWCVAGYNYISGNNAALADVAEDQCLIPQAEMTASNAVEITGTLQDSKYNSCLRLVERTSPRIRIVIPVASDRLISVISVHRNSMNCSPLAGMMMSSICNCDRSGCTVSVCITGDLFVFGTHIGCRYKCLCIGRCHAIVIDAFKYLHTADHREICEIAIWAHKRPHFLGLVVLKKSGDTSFKY